MDIENFIAEFKKTFVYDLLSMTLKDEQLFEHMVDSDAVLWFKEQTRQMWLMWEKAKVQAVPEGFVLVPVKEIKTWYLDDSEGIYREDPEWLCDIPVGEVVEVEHRVSYELDQDPVFAAIQWDEENSDVGYYETFKSKVEAEKVAAHCKAMVETQEQAND